MINILIGGMKFKYIHTTPYTTPHTTPYRAKCLYILSTSIYKHFARYFIMNGDLRSVAEVYRACGYGDWFDNRNTVLPTLAPEPYPYGNLTSPDFSRVAEKNSFNLIRPLNKITQIDVSSPNVNIDNYIFTLSGGIEPIRTFSQASLALRVDTANITNEERVYLIFTADERLFNPSPVVFTPDNAFLSGSIISTPKPVKSFGDIYLLEISDSVVGRAFTDTCMLRYRASSDAYFYQTPTDPEVNSDHTALRALVGVTVRFFSIVLDKGYLWVGVSATNTAGSWTWYQFARLSAFNSPNIYTGIGFTKTISGVSSITIPCVNAVF